MKAIMDLCTQGNAGKRARSKRCKVTYKLENYKEITSRIASAFLPLCALKLKAFARDFVRGSL